ncbi:MAG: DUF4382 domain-containing protein [Bacteroidetes bacterium]|nr:MAG: DUF4382 domain-containing protein [Bacteroidota bacterium]
MSPDLALPASLPAGLLGGAEPSFLWGKGGTNVALFLIQANTQHIMVQISEFLICMTPMFARLVCTVFSLFILFACQSPRVDPSQKQVMFHLHLTDNPGDYQQVNIDLQEVRIKMADSSGWQTMDTYAGIYDLLQLQNGLDTLIVADSLPAGEVDQIRLVLGPNNSIMVDSLLYGLDTPSAQQSGLKVKINKVLVQDSLNAVILDFDAHQSIVARGNGSFGLKPVLRVVE